MNISQNEQGQTLVQLSQEEWENYGNQAGYTTTATETNVTEASVKSTDLTKIASLHEDIKFHQKEIQTKIAQVTQILEGQEVETEVETEEVKGNDDFNEDNYPNLHAQEEQEGLIGAFTPRV